MSDEQDKLDLKIEQAEAAVAQAQKLYDEAEPGSTQDSCLQLLLAEQASLLAKEKALEQVRETDLLQTTCSSRCWRKPFLTVPAVPGICDTVTCVCFSDCHVCTPGAQLAFGLLPFSVA